MVRPGQHARRHLLGRNFPHSGAFILGAPTIFFAYNIFFVLRASLGACRVLILGKNLKHPRVEQSRSARCALISRSSFCGADKGRDQDCNREVWLRRLSSIGSICGERDVSHVDAQLTWPCGADIYRQLVGGVLTAAAKLSSSRVPAAVVLGCSMDRVERGGPFVRS